MDYATPNLPSRSFEATSSFYSKLGFEEGRRGDGCMILKRGTLALEFFSHPQLDPSESWFSCCLRLDDLAGFYDACTQAGLPEMCWGQARVRPPHQEESGFTAGTLVDPDGTLVRLIQN